MINAQALDLTNQDPMVIKLILGCVITLFLCGTSYYFISSTIAGTTAFCAGSQDTFNSLAGNVISNSIPPSIEFVQQTVVAISTDPSIIAAKQAELELLLTMVGL